MRNFGVGRVGGRVRRLVLAATVLGWVGLVVGAGSTPASAQGYGEGEPSRTSLILTDEVSFDGAFVYRYTAPEEIDEPYLIYVVGVDEDGEPFEWITAQVTPAFAGLTWSLQGANMLPGSTYTLEARYGGLPLSDAEVEEAGDLAAESTDAEIEAEPVDEAESDESDESDADADADAGADGGEAAGPSASDDDGGLSVGIIAGLGILALVILGAVGYGIRMRTRHS